MLLVMLEAWGVGRINCQRFLCDQKREDEQDAFKITSTTSSFPEYFCVGQYRMGDVRIQIQLNFTLKPVSFHEISGGQTGAPWTTFR